ncbi:MAG TPA: aspartate kinase [Anaerolineae bacterium]|nr:aspartate kinase [Anaerolineae bacterium]
MTLVMKFGGTSVGSASAMQETKILIEKFKQDHAHLVVVVSAMGSKPVKVTDLLLNGAYAAFRSDRHTFANCADKIRQIHYDAINNLLTPPVQQPLLSEIENFIQRYLSLCTAVAILGELTPRALDAISGMGEQMSARILAAYLQQENIPAQAIDATDLITTDDNFQAATPDLVTTNKKCYTTLTPLLNQGITPIITGFIGATVDNITTTLGRGGSDYSAAIFGQALIADEVWIWTDVDGVMSADPRITPNARSIPTLTYREVGELAYYGARVLHPKTIRPCIEKGIPLRIKNTFNPDHPGTVIVKEHIDDHAGAVKAVTAINDLSLITVGGRGMMGVPGIAARTFGAVAQQDASILLISQSSSEQSICFALPQTNSAAVIAALEAVFATEIARRDIDRITANEPVAIVTAVGAGMQGTPGIAGRLFSALGQNNVNVIAIAQGSSECGVSLVVAGDDTATAIAAIHKLILQD